jgi:hypothetical protein
MEIHNKMELLPQSYYYHLMTFPTVLRMTMMKKIKQVLDILLRYYSTHEQQPIHLQMYKKQRMYSRKIIHVQLQYYHQQY